jgi:hypothetical protein
MTNYLLGGKDHFTPDRVAVESLLDFLPDFRRSVRDSRMFVLRAVKFLAAQGFDYFAEVGCGLPAYPSVQDIAREARPWARVVYIDVDHEAAVQTRVLIATDDRAEALAVDVRDTEFLLAQPRVQDMLRPDNHVAVVAAGLLQFLDDDDAAAVIDTWRRHLPAAGRLVVSDLCQTDASAAQVAAIERAYKAAAAEIRVRSAEQIRALFEGWTWMDPGMVPVRRWRPPRPEQCGAAASRVEFFGGVATPQHRDFGHDGSGYGGPA